MKHIECCRYCVAPKRHPGCHSECSEYIEQRKQLDEYNEVVRQDKFNEKLSAPTSNMFRY